MPQKAEAEYLTQRAARAKCAVKLSEFTRLVEDGVLKGVHVTTGTGHRRLQISVASVDAYLASQVAAEAA